MKSRLTITLSEDILKKIDRLIDKKTIRNRSHAIEHLIEQSLQSRIQTAVILAGGPTKDEYSPLTQIDSRPLILHTLELFKKHGVTTVHIAINEQGLALKDLLATQGDLGLRIVFHLEERPLGTAGAIRAIAPHLQSEDFFVIAGDVLTNINLEEFANFHQENKALVTMAVKPRPAQRTYDNVYVQGHTVVDFKASHSHEIVGIVNAGIYIFSEEMLEKLPTATEKMPKPMLEQDVFPTLAGGQRLTAFSFQGVWFDISVDQNYKQTTRLAA